MGFGEAPLFQKIVLILVPLGFLLQIIGFASEYWTKATVRTVLGTISSHSGLWTNPDGYALPSWFEATQAFETLGFIAALAALVLIILYIFVPATSGKRIVFILSMLACFVAAGCIILGIIIYGAKVKDNLSWSYALCTIAGIIFGVSGILLVVDMLKR